MQMYLTNVTRVKSKINIKMKKLNYDEASLVNGEGGWGCAGAVFGSLAVTLGAGAIVAGTSGAGLALAGFLIAKAGATFAIYDACS